MRSIVKYSSDLAKTKSFLVESGRLNPFGNLDYTDFHGILDGKQVEAKVKFAHESNKQLRIYIDDFRVR